MNKLFSRVLKATGLRSFFEGAGGGRRHIGTPYVPSPMSASLASRKILAGRANGLVLNNALAMAAVNALDSHVIGFGITPQSQHPDENTASDLNDRFIKWAASCDFDALNDFFGLQSVAFRSVVTNGEAFATFIIDENGNLKIRLIDPEQVDAHTNVALAGENNIISGVEFDSKMRRVAYHILKNRPGLPVASDLKSIRILADDMMHLFRVDMAGQVRGVSWFAPCMTRLNDYDQTCDALLTQIKVSALHCGFIVDNLNGGVGIDGVQTGPQELTAAMEPGTIKVLSAGQDFKAAPAANLGNDAAAFLKLQAKEISAGIGVPAELLSHDYAETNYSSARSAIVEFRRRAGAYQWQLMNFRFNQRVWEKWVTLEILSGRLPAPDFASNPDAYFAVDWLGPREEWIDPAKDALAEVTAINAGLMSRRQAVAARGYDIRKIDREIAADNAFAKSLGLEFEADTASGQTPKLESEDE